MTIAPSALAKYVDDIAFAAEGTAATTPQEFAEQLEVAAENLSRAHINGAEDLETAATYLADAMRSTGADRRVLLDKAVEYLSNARDMVDEYRLMA
ncbi:hypothetical protein [Streptomyces himastatinicus]|uniref:hypothetical protein n=1 Tax=Streptomyces himastatinicus TaxID=998084 RepID=UPI0001B4FC72|nr:hypothetical protein [Streptomyces himastatinicus]